MTKRLLFITPIFPQDLSEDTVVPFISQFTQEFAISKQTQIDVISLMYPFNTQQYSFGAVTVYPIGSGFVPFWKQLPKLIKAIRTGRKLHRKNPYDGVLCFWYRESALVGKVLSRWQNLRQIVWMLGQDINKDNRYLRLLRIPVEQLVMMSAQQRDFFFQNHKLKIEKIANVAVSRKLFPALNTGAREIDILGVGNLGALKNYNLFLEVIASLKNKDIKAVIIGEGEEMESLKAKTKQLGLTASIEFSGALPHPQVLHYMNRSKVFLHTSKSEGGGTVLQEALYSGCSVVSTIAIETDLHESVFFYSTEKLQLANQIDDLLDQPVVSKRIENFRMEDAVEILYNCFYKD